MYEVIHCYDQRVPYDEADQKLVERGLAGNVITQKIFRDFTEQSTFMNETPFQDQMSWCMSDYYEDAGDDEYNNGDLRDINNIERIYDYLKWRREFVESEIADIDDEDDPYADELEHIDKFVPYINFLKNTREIVERGLESESDDLRQSFVDDIFKEYVAAADDGAQTTSRKEAFLSGSLPALIDFVTFYHQRLESEATQAYMTEKLQLWRNQYADFLRSENARSYGSNHSIARAAYVVENAPVVIDDPLSTLSRLMQGGEKGELFGMFVPKERAVYVDPFTITHFTSQYLSSEGLDEAALQSQVELSIRKTLLHELIHAYTNTRYFNKVSVYGDPEDPELPQFESKDICSSCQWQKFWREGMTEKLAVMHLADQLGDDVSNHILWDADPEIAQRQAVDSRYPGEQTMLSENAKELKKGLLSTYSDYRSLIDAMFHKLDWESAGLSQQEAEKLAIAAFLEAPEDSSDSSQSNRLAFITAVSKASHPGLFMKLGHLVEHYGPHTLTIMLASENYDPHNPVQTPFIATEDYQSHLKIEALATENVLSQFEGSSLNRESGHQYLKIWKEKLARSAARAALLDEAIKSQGWILELKYRVDKTGALLSAIFGEDIYSEEQIRRQQEPIDEWVEQLK